MPKEKSARGINNIHDALVDYISNNSTFESHEAIEATIKKIEQSASIESIFRIPIEDRLFSFTNALQWLYFICFVINIIKDEHITLPTAFNITFSTDSAIIYLSNKYNAANETFYHDYFDDSDSDSE